MRLQIDVPMYGVTGSNGAPLTDMSAWAAVVDCERYSSFRIAFRAPY